MPNHITNELIFRGVDAAAQAEILAKLCNRDGKVDFDILVPTPANVWLGNVGQFHEKKLGRELVALDWSRVHWGTKWNAYEHRPHEQTADTLAIVFDTAWAPPSPWLVAVFNTLKRDFEHNWLDEGAARGWHSVWTYAALVDHKVHKEPWKEVAADDAMQRHLHKLKWGVEEFPADEDEAAE